MIISAMSGTFRKLSLFLLVLAGTGTAYAATLDLDGNFVQGGLAVGRFTPPAPGIQAHLDKAPVRVDDKGVVVIGFGPDQPPQAELTWRHPDGSEGRQLFEIEQRTYPVQRIDGLPEHKVTPSDEDMARIRAENALIALVRKRDTATPWFLEGFVWPVKGPITGVFGSRRILNGKPRRPHYGVDVARSTGTPVYAPAPGVVALVHEDMYFTGGTVMMDHGYGITSVFSHLSAISVKEGDLLQKGDVLGAVGATGRATGPHLDWRVNWFSTRLDPALLAGKMLD